MSRTIRFHLDENFPGAIAQGLRRLGIDVTTSAEAGLMAATDLEHASFARNQGRVIFTQDRDFLAIHAAGRLTPASSLAARANDRSDRSSPVSLWSGRPWNPPRWRIGSSILGADGTEGSNARRASNQELSDPNGTRIT